MVFAPEPRTVEWMGTPSTEAGHIGTETESATIGSIRRMDRIIAGSVAHTGELAVILRDRILIAGGDLGRVCIADRAAAAFLKLAAQL